MKQIGARQEAGKVGGIGSCGRELCCSTWLTDFKSVNTNAARYQNLSINQTKLSGQCGRLKCCLNYELDTYLDALKNFPDDADVIELAKGRAILVKKDIFRNLMWYSTPGSTKYYPITIDTVKKIKAQNKEGIKPDVLETVEVVSEKMKEVEPEFVDVVGQITLKSLEKNSRRKRDTDRRSQTNNNKSQNRNQQQKNEEQGPASSKKSTRPLNNPGNQGNANNPSRQGRSNNLNAGPRNNNQGANRNQPKRPPKNEI